uniref:Uncharacterized protein n=1 Tax=Nonomuraea gerenzanensis TaxID=93944 RepID=A0A1M4E8B9_9ACTN|nr:hypothetical protein BN4615_P4616 [Nonomuraea gerenzanensis]
MIASDRRGRLLVLEITGRLTVLESAGRLPQRDLTGAPHRVVRDGARTLIARVTPAGVAAGPDGVSGRGTPAGSREVLRSSG